MGLTLTLDSVETSYLSGSIEVSVRVDGRGTADFSLRNGSVSVGTEVGIFAQGLKVFGGYVWAVENQNRKDGKDIITRVQCVDYNVIPDRRVAGERVWENTDVGTIVEDICNTDLSLEGVGQTIPGSDPPEGSIEAGPSVDRWEIVGYPSVTEALNALASYAEMRWYIDAEKAIRFFAPGSNPNYDAAFDVTGANVTALTITPSDEEFANKVILVVGSVLRSEETETFNSAHGTYPTDGARQQFGVGYPIASTPVVKVDGTAQTVGIEGVDTGKQWYWSKGSVFVTQDTGGTPLSSGQALAVTYVGLDNINLEASNTSSIAARATLENGSGIHAKTIRYDAETSIAAAQDVADSLVAYYSDPSITATYDTNSAIEPDCAQLKLGDYQSIAGPGHTTASYVVRSIQYSQLADTGETAMTVEAARGPIRGTLDQLLAGTTQSPALQTGGTVTVADLTPLESTAPDQPGSGDWSIALGPTQADAQTGEQYQRIDITITARPTGVEYWHVWVYEGASAPTDRAQWDSPFSQHITASGSTVIEFWKPRGLTNVTYQIAVTGNTSIVTVWPEPSVTPVKPVTVPAISASTVPTTWDITATSDELAGTLHGKYAITATLPTDENRDYWITERRWTQASWGTPKSDWFPFFSARTLPWEQSPHEWAWPEDEWIEVRFGTVNYAGQITWHGTIKQLHLSGGGKINAGALDPDTVGEGAGIVNNKLETLRAGAGVSNGDLRAGLKDWTLDPASSWSIVTTDAYQGNALRGDGNGVDKFASTNLVPIIPGKAYLATAYARSTTSAGASFMFVGWWNAAGGFITATEFKYFSGDSYTRYPVLGVAPTGAAFARVSFGVPSGATSGRVIIDNVSLIELEPTGGGLTRVDEELVNTTREGGVQNGDFRAGLTFWDVDAGFTLESGGDAYAGNALRGAGNGVLKYATSAPASVIPGRILRCSVYALSNLSGGTAKAFYRYDDKDGDFLSASSQTTISTSGSYVEYSFLDVVPANAAFVRVAFEVPAAATSGRVVIDNVHISVEEPLGSEFTRFNGQVIMDHLAVSKLTAGTAEFSGTVIFRRGTTGGQITIDGDGVKVEKPGTNLRWVNVTNDGLRVTSDQGGGAYVPSLHGVTDVLGAGVRVRNPNNTQYSLLSHDFTQTRSLVIADLVTAANAQFVHGGNQVTISYPASWRTALGIATFSLQYKDHAGTNQTKTIYVP